MSATDQALLATYATFRINMGDFTSRIIPFLEKGEK
jgi:hypothetical protein